MEYDDLKQVMKTIDEKVKSESENSDSDDSDGWSLIPENVLVGVFKYLSIKDLLNSSASCKRWNFISQDTMLWKYKFQTDFKVRKNIARKPGKQSSSPLKYPITSFIELDTSFLVA
jgi:F-box-like